MQGSHSVDAEAIVDVYVGHVYPVRLVDNVDGGVVKFAAHLVVQDLHDGDELGNRLFEEVHGPGLQGLRQDGVVGVGAGAAYHLDGLIHFHSVLCSQEPDELRNHHGGVSVIDLDHGVVRQIVEIGALGRCLLEDQLGGAAHHEILLVNPQDAALIVAVVRIEEEGQVLCNIGLVKGDSLLNQGFIHGLHVEEVELVGAVLIARHQDVIHPSLEGEIPVGHIKGNVRPVQPGVIRDPGIGHLLLLIVLKELLKEAEVIVEPHAVPVKPQGGDGVKEAGG